MAYAYVKRAKTGELAEGENPMHVIRVDEEVVGEYLNPSQETDEKWEMAEESEYTEEVENKEDGEVVEEATPEVEAAPETTEEVKAVE